MKRLSSANSLILVTLLAGAAAGCAQQPRAIQRHAYVIGIKKECIPEYKKLHAATWPGVLKLIRDCHITNYSIYLAEVKPDEFYLFSYLEYTGDDMKQETDAKMKNDPTTKEWWKHTDPLQSPVPTRKPGEWWHEMEEVFHTD